MKEQRFDLKMGLYHIYLIHDYQKGWSRFYLLIHSDWIIRIFVFLVFCLYSNVFGLKY